MYLQQSDLWEKENFGQLQPFELVVIIMIADVASVPMQNAGTPIIQGIVPILALLVHHCLHIQNVENGARHRSLLRLVRSRNARVI